MAQSNLSVALHSRPFQMEGARFVMQRRNAIIADEPGLGKTIQSIAAVVGSKTRGSVLIVAPKTAAYITWPAQLERWLHDVSPDDPIRIIGGKLDKAGRLMVLRETLAWDRENCPEEQDPTSVPRRQWIIVSPNYLRFKAELDADGRYKRDSEGEKIIHPVGVALKPLLYVEWSAVIIDEAHETLAGSTGAVKKMSGQSRGLRLLDVREDGLRIALSGTPFRGKHVNLWGMLNWIEPQQYPDGDKASGKRGTLPYWKWVKKHFEVFHDDTYNTDVIGNLRSEAELAREARQYMVRRTKRAVLPELPDKLPGGEPLYPNRKPPAELVELVAKAARWQKAQLAKPGLSLKEQRAVRTKARVPSDRLAQWYDKNNPIAVWLPMDGPQAKAYKQMKDTAMADIEGGTLLANSILAELVRLKQFANSYGTLNESGDFTPALPSNKFDWLLNFLKERGIDGSGEASEHRVVVGSQFTKHVNLFARELREKHKIPCYVLTGATSADDRARYQKEFQSGKLANGRPSPQLFLGNLHAMGKAIDLDAADDLVVLDRTHSSDDQVQLEDRIHRMSRIHQVTIWNLCTRNTIDQQVLRETRKTGRSLLNILDTPQAALALLES